MKILITGSTGFIGNHLIEYLIKNTSHDIIASGTNLKKAKSRNWFSKVLFIEADLSKKEKWFNFFGEPDILIHLAWPNLPNHDKSFHLNKNLPNEIFFLDQMIDGGLKRLIVTGTCFEYGMQNGCLNEELPTFPANPYSIAKDTLRRYLELKTKNIVFKWLRLFYMFGKGQNSKSLFSQLNQALENKSKIFNMSEGNQVRDYLPVVKVSELIVKVSFENNLSGIYNICSGNPKKLVDLVRQYIQNSGNHIDLNLGYYPYSNLEPMDFWGCDKKINHLL